MSIPVLLLVIANLAMYVIVGVSGGSWLTIQPAVLVHWGANQGALTIGHEWWRLVASMFLHGGLVHLVVNMVSLLYLGRWQTSASVRAHSSSRTSSVASRAHC